MNLRAVAGIALLALIVAAGSATVLTAPNPQQPALTAYRTDDGDFSEWKNQVIDQGWHVQTVVTDAALLLQEMHPSETLLVIPQPQTRISLETQEAWSVHLESGGSLLIMDAAGLANSFLHGLGVAVTDRSLLDPSGEEPLDVRVQEPGMAVTKPILGRSPSSLLIEDGKGWVVILESGAESYLDVDQNSRIDVHDIPGPHAVAASLQTQAGGRLIVMTSTTFLANTYFEDIEAGNKDKMFNLLTDGLPTGSLILIDESHHGWTFPENQMVSAAKTLSIPQKWVPWTVAITATLAGVASFAALKSPTVGRYAPHQLARTAIEPHLLDHTDGFFTVMAQEVISHRRPGTIHDTPESGASSSNGGWLEQAANGQLRPEDRIRLIQLYESEVNQHA